MNKGKENMASMCYWIICSSIVYMDFVYIRWCRFIYNIGSLHSTWIIIMRCKQGQNFLKIVQHLIHVNSIWFWVMWYLSMFQIPRGKMAHFLIKCSNKYRRKLSNCRSGRCFSFTADKQLIKEKNTHILNGNTNLVLRLAHLPKSRVSVPILYS